MNVVLLIDDEPQMSKLVSMCLDCATARVVRAGNLAEAIDAARAERPNVVLLDLSLGSEDGLAILPRLREEPAMFGVPVIAFTVHDSREEEALERGVQGFIIKPFKTDGLQSVLEPFLMSEV